MSTSWSSPAVSAIRAVQQKIVLNKFLYLLVTQGAKSHTRPKVVMLWCMILSYIWNNMTEKPNNIANEPTADYGKIYTYADYVKFEFDEMVELIRGKIFKMSPAPKSYHQEISMKLGSHIFIQLGDKSCKVYSAPFDVVLPVRNESKNRATTVVQPDICVICDVSKIDEAGCVGAPDLIIEILSESTSKKDLNDKYQVYEESGVREYWIVMPKERLLEVFHLENGKYQRIKTYVDDDKISPVIFPELEIDLQNIFPEKKI